MKDMVERCLDHTQQKLDQANAKIEMLKKCVEELGQDLEAAYDAIRGLIVCFETSGYSGLSETLKMHKETIKKAREVIE